MPWAAAAAVVSEISANKARKSQQKGNAAAIAEQRRQYDLNRQDTQVQRDAGERSINALGETIYDPNYYKASAEEVMAQEPGYQFSLAEGQKAIERQGSASGRRLSPATVKELMRYNIGYANQSYGSAYNRFMGEKDRYQSNLYKMAGLGDTANKTNIAAGTNISRNISGIQQTAGNQQAAGYGNMNQAIQGSLKNYQTLNSYNKALNLGGSSDLMDYTSAT